MLEQLFRAFVEGPTSHDSSHFVVIILRTAFAARVELDHLAKNVLPGSFGNRCGVVKVS